MSGAGNAAAENGKALFAPRQRHSGEARRPSAVHSFKLRGAYAMMAGLTEEQKAHGVITASAGNHAQGVAFSSARLA
jgi:hypothetical protein